MSRSSGVYMVLSSLVLAGSLRALAGAPDANASKRPLTEIGEDVFFHETFGGNDRTCATCHDPRGEFTVSPELVQARFALDPNHPLFRAIDSDDGRGRDYTTLLARAVFNVTVTLPPNVRLVDDPLQRTITVRRGVPGIANVELTGPYLVDGRASTLAEQAAGAIRGHMQPRRAPTARELDAIAAFEKEQFYPLRMRSLRDLSDPLERPPGFTVPVASLPARRGRGTFERHCQRCHGGETGDRPASPETGQFATVFVSEANVPGFPMLRLAFQQPDGSIVETITPDPGRAAITGRLEDLNAFDTPSLRGVKHTAPYFHDNSAPTLDAVIEHYNGAFQFRIFGTDKDDLIAYLELL